MGSQRESQAAPRAVIYCRVSTRSQEREGTSLETQEAACRTYVEEHGYRLAEIEVYREVASGHSLDRPELDAVRRAVRAGELDVVVVHAFDRLSRGKQAHSYILAEEAENAGARIESVTEKFEDSATGRFIRSTQSFIAEIEREKLIERTQRGLRARIESGKPLAGGKPIYGYRWKDPEKSGLVIFEPEAEIVRRIFQALADGDSSMAMVRRLHAEGIPSPSNKVWCASTVGRMVKNDAYVGKAWAQKWDCPKRTSKSGKSYLGQVLKPEAERVALPNGTFPAIVTPELAEKALSRLKTNRERFPSRATSPEDFLLRAGHIRCGVCGHAMVARHSEGRTIYSCQSSYRDARTLKHRAPHIESGKVDRQAWEHAKLVLGDPDYIREQLKKQLEPTTTDRDLESDKQLLLSIDRQAAGLRLSIRTAERDFPADAVQDVVRDLTKDLIALSEERRRALARQAEKEEQAAAASRTMEALDAFEASFIRYASRLDEMTYAERRAAIEHLGVQVRVWPEGGEKRVEVEMRFDIAQWLDHDPDDDLGIASYRRSNFQSYLAHGAPELRTATSRP